MKFLTNIDNPTLPDAKEKLMTYLDETQQEAWERQERWLSDKVLLLPKETDAHTVRELIRMGMVGVYDPNDVEEIESEMVII